MVPASVFNGFIAVDFWIEAEQAGDMEKFQEQHDDDQDQVFEAEPEPR